MRTEHAERAAWPGAMGMDGEKARRAAVETSIIVC
jgi:hypothetical protein